MPVVVRLIEVLALEVVKYRFVFSGTFAVFNVTKAPAPVIYSADVPPAVIASVPEVVIGEPVTLNAAGTVSATLVTVPVLAVAPAAMPSNLVLSDALIAPALPVVAAAKDSA